MSHFSLLKEVFQRHKNTSTFSVIPRILAIQSDMLALKRIIFEISVYVFVKIETFVKAIVPTTFAKNHKIFIFIPNISTK